ncbi:MAG: glycosyltransferase family 4 protein [Bacteroidia bacterium]|nr:glycosyltransferase family 4 protein [Bacteroidia bacterium]
MNILISLTNLYMGGAQTFVINLARILSIRNKVYLYCVLPEQFDIALKSRLPKNIKLLYFPFWLNRFTANIDNHLIKINLKLWINDFCKKLHLLFFIKILKIQIVSSHLFHSDKFTTDKLQQKVPIIITDHGDYNYVIEQGFSNEFIVKQILTMASHVVYISKINKDRIIEITGLNENRFTRINNGIPKTKISTIQAEEIRTKMRIDKNDFIFGMVARGIKEKGWEIAIEAFIRLSTAKVNVRLLLVGDSDYLEHLNTTYEKYPNIQFLGQISDPFPIISIMNVGLLPSYFQGESMPMVIIEYLSCNVPIIASDLGSIREMIQYKNQSAGQLLPPSFNQLETISELTKSMQKYIDDTGLYLNHKNNCSICFEQFDIEIISEKYEELFSKHVRK